MLMAKGAAAGGAGSSRLLLAEPALHRSAPLWQHKIGKMLLLPKGNSLEFDICTHRNDSNPQPGNCLPVLNGLLKHFFMMVERRLGD
jgi:hypothetical protein